MKKVLKNRKFWIGMTILVVAIILYLLIRKKKTDGTMSLLDSKGSEQSTQDSWDGFRESLGDWTKKTDDDKMWTAAGDLFLSHLDDHDQRNTLIPPYWRAMYAWFKGYNIKPDGYQVIINQSLRDAIVTFVKANPGITQASVTVGQFI